MRLHEALVWKRKTKHDVIFSTGAVSLHTSHRSRAGNDAGAMMNWQQELLEQSTGPTAAKPKPGGKVRGVVVLVKARDASDVVPDVLNDLAPFSFAARFDCDVSRIPVHPTNASTRSTTSPDPTLTLNPNPKPTYPYYPSRRPARSRRKSVPWVSRCLCLIKKTAMSARKRRPSRANAATRPVR